MTIEREGEHSWLYTPSMASLIVYSTMAVTLKIQRNGIGKESTLLRHKVIRYFDQPVRPSPLPHWRMYLQKPELILPRDRSVPSPGGGGLAGLAVRGSDHTIKSDRFNMRIFMGMGRVGRIV